MKGLFQVEVIKDVYYENKEGKKRELAHKVGEIVWIYGYWWIVDKMGMFAAFKDVKNYTKAEFFDMSFFKIWVSDRGWFWVQECHFKPVGAKLNLPGIC